MKAGRDRRPEAAQHRPQRGRARLALEPAQEIVDPRPAHDRIEGRTRPGHDLEPVALILHDAGDRRHRDDAVARNSEKALPVELLGEDVQRKVHHVAAAVLRHQVGILLLGVEIGDFLALHGHDPVVEAHDVALLVGARRTDGRQQPLGVEARVALPAPLDGPLQRRGVDRLEQVVDAVDLEGPHGIAVVGGRHDDAGRDVDLPEDLEAVAVGELHIHEDHVGDVSRRAEPLDGLAHRAGRTDNPQVGVVLRERPHQVLLGHGLVFNDQYSHGIGL